MLRACKYEILGILSCIDTRRGWYLLLADNSWIGELVETFGICLVIIYIEFGWTRDFPYQAPARCSVVSS